jgi:LDH2 family malate/lactate/ureidoglycolate dehydrogenase
MAEAKGFGLGLMVEILTGVISGAGFSQQVASIFGQAPGRNGHFLLALDIQRLLPFAAYYERIEQLVVWVKGSAAEGVTITYPGERRFQALDETSRDGVPLDDSTLRLLGILAGTLRVGAPFRIPAG